MHHLSNSNMQKVFAIRSTPKILFYQQDEREFTI